MLPGVYPNKPHRTWCGFAISDFSAVFSCLARWRFWRTPKPKRWFGRLQRRKQGVFPPFWKKPWKSWKQAENNFKKGLKRKLRLLYNHHRKKKTLTAPPKPEPKHEWTEYISWASLKKTKKQPGTAVYCCGWHFCAFVFIPQFSLRKCR